MSEEGKKDLWDEWLSDLQYKLTEINLDQKGNLLPINKVQLGFVVHCCPSKHNKWDINTTDETKNFNKVQCFVVSTLKKVFDRSPFTCEFGRYCSVLNPVVTVSCEQKGYQKHFKLLPNKLMKLNILLLSQCDAGMDFTSFCNYKFKKFREEFENSRKKVVD